VNGREHGRLEVPGGQVWYRIYGSGEAAPLLVVHGGPGAGHDYLEPLEVLSGDGRPVILWDQLGCGRSDAPDDTGLYSMSRFVEEIAAIRGHLGLGQVHLLGQSLGGWFVIEYLLGAPAGVLSVELASTSASMASLMRGLAELRAELPHENRAALETGEATGDLDSDAYRAAEERFVRRHVCRLDPMPGALVRTIDNTNRSPAYRTMWGRNQFLPTGNLSGWDRAAQLSALDVPTLITCGRHDKFVPACSKELHRLLPRSRLHVFEHSSHMSHLEETDHFVAVAADFLDRVDRRAVVGGAG
jgi:proline-specific peptidase